MCARSKFGWTCSISILILTARVAWAQQSSTESVTSLTLTPRAIESPLMKYRLLPAEYELVDGNAATILLRLPWDQTVYFSTTVPTFEGLMNLPLDDPKVRDAQEMF